MITFAKAKVGMVIRCKETPEPHEIMMFSAGFRVQLQMLPTEEGRQYISWPMVWLNDYEFDAAKYRLV